MSETLIPTCSFRWFVDYDGERILQQRFDKPSGFGCVWKNVPETTFHAERENESMAEILRKQSERPIGIKPGKRMGGEG